MKLVSRREYLLLLAGDVAIFFASLWITLATRYVAIPSSDILGLHLFPFTVLFIVWVGVFFVAGLYGKYTRLFRQKLLTVIIVSQTINILLAALFFFLVPGFLRFWHILLFG